MRGSGSESRGQAVGANKQPGAKSEQRKNTADPDACWGGGAFFGFGEGAGVPRRSQGDLSALADLGFCGAWVGGAWRLYHRTLQRAL